VTFQLVTRHLDDLAARVQCSDAKAARAVGLLQQHQIRHAFDGENPALQVRVHMASRLALDVLGVSPIWIALMPRLPISL
jgi:hypothetical protein